MNCKGPSVTAPIKPWSPVKNAITQYAIHICRVRKKQLHRSSQNKFQQPVLERCLYGGSNYFLHEKSTKTRLACSFREKSAFEQALGSRALYR